MRFLRWWTVLCFCLWAIATMSGSLAEEGAIANSGRERPNLILIIMDTVRFDRLSCHGNPIKLTPHLDRFADEAFLFRNAFSTAPWTLPSIASLYTSRYPQQHGAGGVYGDFTVLGSDEVTLAEQFKSHGYETAAIVNVLFLARKFGLDQGFDHLDVSIPEDNLGDRNATETTEAAVKWLDRNHSDPFVLVAHYFDPHLVYNPPQPFRKRFADPRDQSGEQYLFGTGTDVINLRKRTKSIDRATMGRLAKLYLGEIAYVDFEIGRLLKAINQRGYHENSIVVITADHGEEFADHGDFEHGHSFYDELVHVPLMIRLPMKPDQIPRRALDTSISQIDIAPTLCELAGIPVSESFYGRNLMPILRGDKVPERPIFHQGNMWGIGGSAIRYSGYKLIQRIDAVPPQLFNVSTDPRERNDLAEIESARLDDYLKMMNSFKLSLGERKSPNKHPEISEEERARLRSLGYIK